MKVIALSDERGNIVSLHRAGREDSDSGTTGVLPMEGQLVHEIQLPEELRRMPLLELHKGFCIDLKGKQPCFVRVRGGDGDNGGGDE